MRPERNPATWIFRIAAAVTAAAVADPLVESLSNAGVFGRGHFTDRSTLDVLPALCIAGVLSVLFVSVLVRRTLSTGASPPRWLRRCAEDVHAGSLRGALPSIYAVQMSILLVMETLEQIATAGHPLGAGVWLGAPAPISMLLHALSCVVVTWSLSRILSWSARRIVRVVRFVREFLRRLLEQQDAPLAGIRSCTRTKFIEPYLRGLQGRAPPVPSVP